VTPNPRLRGGLRLWPVGIVLALTFALAMAVAATVFFVGWGLLGARSLKPERQLTSSTLFDLVKLAFGVVAGAGALVALVVAYRRQRVDEDGARREEEAASRETTRLHTERFTTAVSQLGDDSAAVRLGGVHALAGLADDAPTRDLRQTCIDVLCAYLRLPYTAETDLPADDTDARHAYLSLRQVRYTVIRLIRDHLRLGINHPHSWQGHDFDFTGAVFDGGDFSEARFNGGIVQFAGAVFSSGKVNFRGSTFSGGKVYFNGAMFSGGEVNFRGSTFDGGTVNFYGSVFSGGTVCFSGAVFSGGEVHFSTPLTGSTFSGGTVDFSGAVFSSGEVHFTAAVFNGSTVDFNRAVFSGSTVDFVIATFDSGTALFNRSTFSGGTVDFNAAVFSGGTVDFNDAVFSGGTVHFRDTVGAAPSGLLPANGQSLPDGVTLSPAW
jgi:uncharacterized protein YjbI with pentapeptide repeats/membrane protein implicated in regulation of membrane protease activity